MRDVIADPPTPAPARKRGRWPRRLLLATALLAAPVLAGAVYFVFRTSPLAVVRAELDQLDPGWRLEDIEASRPRVPDEANAALLVTMVYGKLPKSWPGADRDNPELTSAVSQALGKLPPPVQLEAAHRLYLAEALEEAEDCLGAARQLADRPRGRFPVVWSPDYFGTKLGHISEVRNGVGRLLEFDALVRAHDGDMSGALVSLRAACNAYRAIGDEPSLISVLVRYAGRGVVCSRLERLLGLGEIPEADLAAFQKLLEDEAAEPLLLIGLRGERAGFHHLAESVDRGVISAADLDNLLAGLPSEARSPFDQFRPGQLRRLEDMFAECLRVQTLAVQTARLPWAQQTQAWEAWKAERNQVAEPGRSLLIALEKAGQAGRRTQAQLHCAITMLAVERFRLRQGRWPATLNELRPAYLDQVLTDPYDGRPLRFRRLQDSVLVYSVGPDGVDNGGAIARPFVPSQQDTDLGVQLWDVAHRRQPAVEPPELLPPSRVADK